MGYATLEDRIKDEIWTLPPPFPPVQADYAPTDSRSVDGFHSRRGPRGNLNSLPFIPTIHKAFKKNLVTVLDRDAYSLHFSFETPSQRVFDLLFDVYCIHMRFDYNIIYNATDARELSNIVFGGLLLKIPIDITC